MPSSTKGQSLFEVIVAVGVAAIIIGSAATVMVVSMRAGKSSVENQKGYAVAQNVLSTARSYAESDWSTFYNNAGLNQQFYFLEGTSTPTSTPLTINTGTTTVSLFENEATMTYTAWFTIDNIYRDSNNAATLSSSGTVEDPSTLRVTAYVDWSVGGGTKEVSMSQQISRTRSDIIQFSQWGEGDATTTGNVSVTSDGGSIHIP